MKLLLLLLVMALGASSCKKDDHYNYKKYDCDDKTVEEQTNCPCKEYKKFIKEREGRDIDCKE